MENKIALIIVIILYQCSCFADDDRQTEISLETEGISKCLGVAMGNFENREAEKKAIKIFYAAIIENIKEMTAIESEYFPEEMLFMQELMGDDIFIGFMMKNYLDVSPEYQSEKNDLMKSSNWDWKQVHKELWEKHNCNAIYTDLNLTIDK